MSKYDEAYFLHGKETGVSLYENYRWLPELTIPMVQSIINHLSLERCKILDFGCARGYMVKAFRGFGYESWGIDKSEWAIRNCHPDVRGYVNWTENSPPLLPMEFDWIFAKDVLEHVDDVEEVILGLQQSAKRGVFAIVPLSLMDHMEYVVSEYEHDVTHKHRLQLGSWAQFFMRPGWSVEASFRVKGVKDNYAEHEWGNGFITARRLEK